MLEDCWDGGWVRFLPSDHEGLFLSSLLQETKGSVAVRVALGETQLVQEVRRFLIDHGVSLDSFSQVGARATGHRKVGMAFQVREMLIS